MSHLIFVLSWVFHHNIFGLLEISGISKLYGETSLNIFLTDAVNKSARTSDWTSTPCDNNVYFVPVIVGTFRSVDASADEVFCDTVVMTLVTLGPCGCSTWNISFSLKRFSKDVFPKSTYRLSMPSYDDGPDIKKGRQRNSINGCFYF